MRRLILSLCLLVVASTCATAQYFGARVGVNNTNVNIETSNTGLDVDTKGQTNLMLGAFADLPIGTNLISIQPEINYLNRGYKNDAIDFEQTISFLDLGAILKLNFGRDAPLGFYVGAGPYVTYAISGKQTLAGIERDLDFDNDRVKRGGVQFTGLGGVTFGESLKFFAEVRYNGSLYNLSDDDDTDIKQNSIGLSGGIMVPLF